MRLLRIAALAVALTLAAAASAQAMPELILHGHRVVRREDRYLPNLDLPPAPQAPRTLYRRAAKRPKQPPATERALSNLVNPGVIDAAHYYQYLGVYRAAVAADQRLRGTRQTELAAVIANADTISASGALTPDRLAAVFMTLDRNRQWWTTAQIPAPHDRVGFAGSQLVWEYYPGEGIELQMLANFGKANGFYLAHQTNQLRALLGELLPLGAARAGGIAWEYLFSYSGGAPPWTSAISQGTAVQVLARASKRLKDPSLAALGQRALAIFQQPPPAGVRVATPIGAHYLIYSFAPQTFVLNSFIQSLVGLYDFSQMTGDPTAAALFAAGDAEARVEVPRYDTGAWSLYSLTEESDLSYHQLVIGFLHNLCTRTSTPVYCQYEQRFTGYLHTPPVVAPATARLNAGRPSSLAFTLDKISHVTVTVRRGSKGLYAFTGTLGRGPHTLAWTSPGPSGPATLTVAATDLAGNSAQASAPLTIVPARKKHK